MPKSDCVNDMPALALDRNNRIRDGCFHLCCLYGVVNLAGIRLMLVSPCVFIDMGNLSASRPVGYRDAALLKGVILEREPRSRNVQGLAIQKR